MRPPASGRPPVHGTRRLVRVGAFGGSSLLLALTAHLVGGGSLPGPAVLAVAAVVLGLIAVTLTRRRVRGVALLVTLAVEQLGLHLLFDLATTTTVIGCTGSMAGMHPGSACVTNAATSVPAVSPMTGTTGMTGHALTSGPGLLMALGHLIATVATGWLLTRAEAALWRIGDQLRAALAGPGRRPTRRRTRPSPPAAVATLIIRPDRSGSPRGPPRRSVLSFCG